MNNSVMTLYELAQKAEAFVVTPQMIEELSERLREAEVQFEEIAKAKHLGVEWLNKPFGTL